MSEIRERPDPIIIGASYVFRRIAYVNNGLGQITIGGSPGLTSPTLDIFSSDAPTVTLYSSAMGITTVANGQLIYATTDTGGSSPLTLEGDYIGQMTVMQGVRVIKIPDYFSLVGLGDSPCGC